MEIAGRVENLIDVVEQDVVEPVTVENVLTTDKAELPYESLNNNCGELGKAVQDSTEDASEDNKTIPELTISNSTDIILGENTSNITIPEHEDDAWGTTPEGESQIDTLNETSDPDGQVDFVEAASDLQESIDKDLLCNVVSPGKRTGKVKLLKDEQFDNHVYKNNQCGFSTDRPLYWALEVEKYIQGDDDVTGKTFFKAPKGNSEKYTLIKFIIYYQITKQIVLLVNLSSGTFMVKGQSFQTWIDDEYPKLTCNDPSSVNKTTSREDRSIEALWELSLTNKVGITNLDVNAENMSKDLENSKKSLIATQENFDKRLREVEEGFDKKVMAFTDLLGERFDERCNEIVRTFENKIREICEKIGKFKMSVQNQINGMGKPEEEEEDSELVILRHSIEQQKKEIANLVKESTDINSHNEEEMEKLLSNIEELKCELNKKMDISIPPDITTPTDVPIQHNIPTHPAVPTNQSNTVSREQNLPAKTRNIELLICMDSNRRHIDFRRLWTLKGSLRKPFGNLNELKRYVSNHDIKSLKYILINIGVNDIDTKNGDVVCKEIKSIVDKLLEEFPALKVILSEITPRTDGRDNEVMKCNELLNSMASNYPNVIIAHHSNLRDDDYTMFEEDNPKHITDDATPRFASNLKRALRKAYGMDEFRRDIDKTVFNRNHSSNKSYSRSNNVRDNVQYDDWDTNNNNFNNYKFSGISGNQFVNNPSSHQNIRNQGNQNTRDIDFKEMFKNAFFRFLDSDNGSFSR